MKAGGLLKRLGPGFVTGTSDDDPAGIGTYIQAGAQSGYAMLWTALFSTPLMAAVQEMCGRIGIVTGRGIAPNIRRYYSPAILWFIIVLQIATNTINVGADLSAMAQSTQLLVHVSYGVLLAVTTIVMVALITFVPYKQYSTILKVLGLMLLSYVVAAFTVHADWHKAIVSTFVPHVEWSSAFLLAIIAVLGVTISPYEFFWQASEEVEELVEEGKMTAMQAARPTTDPQQIVDLRWDTAFGMIFSNLITFFVIVTAAATLNATHHTDIQSAADAAAVLKPLAGPYAAVLFTLGLVSSGLLAIPVMAASSAYAIGGALNWPRTLSAPFWKERRFYGVIAATCAVGLLVNALRIPPFKLLYYSGVLNGIISPFLLFLVTHMSGNKRIMGPFANSWLKNLLGYTMAACMAAAIVAFFWLQRSAS